jgi:hypothetical protein
MSAFPRVVTLSLDWVLELRFLFWVVLVERKARLSRYVAAWVVRVTIQVLYA